MICDKCGYNMPAECCVIGNYWDCTSCRTNPNGWTFEELPGVMLHTHDEILTQVRASDFEKYIRLKTEGILEEISREVAIWGAYRSGRRPLFLG